MGAATLPQLEQTSMKTFFEMFPQEFITDRSIQKNHVNMINGHRVLFRPLDAEGKARSLNLSCWHIEEASEVKYEYFVQLQTRLRNHATIKHIGILSSNPDVGWLRSEFLLKSAHIHNSEETYEVSDPNPNFSTHIAPTHLNIHLPPTFYEDTARGKASWWIERYLNGSFINKEGLVYPMYQDNIVEPFDIPKNWERTFSVDPGLVDPTAAPFAAIDPKTGIVYIYDEHYENQKPVSHHAKVLNEKIKDIPSMLLRPPVMDTKGFATSERDMRSLADHYAEYGLYFQKATRKLEDSIMKMYGYFELGKLKIFSSCKHTLHEFQNYKYPERSLDDDKSSEKPIDKNNHLMDSIRYLIAELPDNPNDLINESYNTYSMMEKRPHDTYLPHALQEESSYEDADDWSQYY